MRAYKNLFSFIFVNLFFFIFAAYTFAADTDVILNEVMYDVPGNDTDKEWVELINNGNEQVTLIGGNTSVSWRINDGSNHTLSADPIQGSLTIEPGGVIVIAKNASVFLTDYPNFSGNLIESPISLKNTSSAIGLRIGSGGDLWGQLEYNSSIGASGDGNSIQRKTDGSLIAAFPTVGSANASEPVSTSTPTPTPTNTPTPTKTPTSTPTIKPTATLVPTKIPITARTKTPTTSPTKFPSPTLKAISTVGTAESIEPSSEAFPTSVLGESTESALEDDNDNPLETAQIKETKTDGNQANILARVLVSVGVIFVIASGILAFRNYINSRKDKDSNI